MQLPPPLFDLFTAVAAEHPYRRELLAALIEHESGWNPLAVGDTTWTRDQILAAYRTGGLAAAKASGASLGLGQINAVHWTDSLNPEVLLTPGVNLQFAARLLAQHYTAAGGDQREALRRYNGVLPVGTPRYEQRERTYVDVIMAWADQAGREGIHRGPPPPAPSGPSPAPAGFPASPAGAVTITLTGIDLRAMRQAQSVLRRLLQAARAAGLTEVVQP